MSIKPFSFAAAILMSSTALSAYALDKGPELSPGAAPGKEMPKSSEPNECAWEMSGLYSYCYVDIETATLECADNVIPDVTLVSTHSGIVLEVDMANYKMLQVGTLINDPRDYALHIGDSPSNNGWSGDSGDFSNDSEAHLFGNTLLVYGSDITGNPEMLKFPDILPDGDGVAWAGICDSTFLWYSWDFVNPSINGRLTDTAGLFQIDGNELDVENGGTNDTKLYVGLERTVGSASRTGSDLYDSPYGSGIGFDATLVLIQ